MNKRTIIIISSTTDAKWALKYIANQHRKKIILLATTLETQIFLNKKGYDSFTYFKLLNDDHNFDLYNIKREELKNKKISKITDKITSFLDVSNFTYRNISLSQIIKYHLHGEIEKTYYYYNLCNKLKSKFRPTKILINVNNLKYLNPCSKIFKNLTTYQSHLLNLQKINLLKYLYSKLSKLSSKIIARRNPHKNTRIIFQSGGHILYYFHRFIKLLDKQNPPVSCLLLTFKQTLKDNLALVGKQIIPLKPPQILNRHKVSKENLQKHVNYKELFARLYLDKQLAEMLKNKTTSYLNENLNQMIVNIDKSYSIFEKIKPKLFITTHDLGISSMPYVLTARALGIKTLQVQHGLYMYPFEVVHNTDFVAVWGKKSQQILSDKYRQNNIYTIGFPGFDNLITKKGKTIENRTVFSIITTAYGVEENYLNKFLYGLFSRLRDIKYDQILLRAHPGQDTAGINALARHLGITKLKINPNMSIDKFVTTSDIILSMDTSVILWAMHYHKPLFHTSPWWGKTIFPTKEYKAAWVPNDAGDLIRRINQYQKTPEIVRDLIPGQNKFLKDFAGPLDQKSSERLINLVENIIK